MRVLLTALVLAASTMAFANEEKVVKLDTRPGVSVSFYYMKRDGARATVVVLMGGGGGIGLKGGVPRSQNFLVRRHGFVGMEKEAVEMIADWIKNPKP